MPQLTELSLFTGAGGGVWASKLLNHKVIGYVEFNEYCQRVIRARIDDGSFDNAPIFTDVREFVESGAAREYRGFADVVSGGFPCQPFSVGGNQKGEEDERDMWPATRDIIRDVRPRFAFLENVPNIFVFRYFGGILRELAKMGYSVKWCSVSGREVGAVHLRERAWILATDQRQERVQRHRKQKVQRFTGFPWGEDVRGIADVRNRPDLPESLVRRIGNDVAFGKHRLEATGNGQIPRVAAAAFNVLIAD
jgi:DNA (cytosine-5)-methyltransferase 1